MIRVGISQGDINGIGWEIIFKCFSEPAMLELCTPVIFGSNKTLSYHRKALEIEEFNFNLLRDLDQIAFKRINLVNTYDDEAAIEFGKVTATGGKFALVALEKACDALLQNKIDVLVTAPVNKHAVQLSEAGFKGHTEYLQQKFSAQESVMILCNDNLRVALVSGHVPLSEVAKQITTEKILAKIKILNKSLISDFGIRKPKIAVLGLNPHAGDNGTLGNEEKDIIIPAINKAKEEGMFVQGPYSADGFFGSGNYLNFDAILAMYHDQGLVPFKTISFNNGVNFTAGLPFVRTSPDHGTAYEIVGKNIASPDSFRKAIYTAIDIFNSRKEYQSFSGNPLKTTPLKAERG